MPPAGERRGKRAKVPWLPFLLLLTSVFVFWVLPRLLPDRPVQVEFVGSKAN